MGEGTWVGLDVHARKVVAGVLDAQTSELRSWRAPTLPAETVEWLKQFPAPVRVAYEAGPTGYGLPCAAPPWGRPPAAPCPHAGFDAGLALDGRADARPCPSRRCRCPKRLTMRVAPTFSDQRRPSRLKFDHAQTQL